MVEKVYSVEIVKLLADQARKRLKSLGYGNVEVRHGNGYLGWPEQAPFDIIIVAAAPDTVPEALIDQLEIKGKLLIPVGERSHQNLLLIEKQSDGTVTRRTIVAVAFVPMTGEPAEEN